VAYGYKQVQVGSKYMAPSAVATDTKTGMFFHPSFYRLQIDIRRKSGFPH
jgi:hypothetical protein